jgi:K+-sensing histidine kinase KdpD
MSSAFDYERSFGERLLHFLRVHLLDRPAKGSGSAYSFAIVCVAVAAVWHGAFSYFIGNLTPSVTYYPAVLIAAIFGGVRAGAVAAVLSSIMVWWAIDSPYFGARASPTTELINRCLYVAATIIIIWLAERFRRADAKKDDIGETEVPLLTSEAGGRAAEFSGTSRLAFNLRRLSSGGLLPNSVSAYLFAFVCIALATFVRFVLSRFASDILPFTCYYPAVLLAALVGGMGAGLFAVFLSALGLGWSFLPGYRPVDVPGFDQIASCGLYVLASMLAVWVAWRGRRIFIREPRIEAQTLDYIAPALVSLAAVLLTTILLLSFESLLQAQHLVLAYLLPTTLIAIAYGSTFAFLTSFASAVAAAYFLFPPKFSLYVADPLHVAELGFFIVFAIIASKTVAVLTYDVRERPNRIDA